jgi:nucleoside-diphosphate-sugar epimerase
MVISNKQQNPIKILMIAKSVLGWKPKVSLEEGLEISGLKFLLKLF